MKAQERVELLQALKARFEKNMDRHKGIAWDKVRAELEGNPEALKSLREMEVTGGEPDVIGRDTEAGCYTFCDCSAETPVGRRSVCYDREALESRKEHKPKASAVEMAAAMGIDLLTEEQYRELQRGEFRRPNREGKVLHRAVRLHLAGRRYRGQYDRPAFNALG